MKGREMELSENDALTAADAVSMAQLRTRGLLEVALEMEAPCDPVWSVVSTALIETAGDLDAAMEALGPHGGGGRRQVVLY